MRLTAYLLALAAAFAPPPVARAGDLSAEVALASDYVFRGFSRTGSEPALQAGFRYQHRGGLFAGAWASTVRFDYDHFADRQRRLELHAFAGYAATLKRGWSGSALLVHYHYPDADRPVDMSYTEASLNLYFRDLVSVTVACTPDFLSSGRSGVFAELAGRYPLPRGVELSAGIGRAELDVSDETGYTYGHLAVGRSAGRFGIDLGYYLSGARDVPNWGEVADGSWALVVSARLP